MNVFAEFALTLFIALIALAITLVISLSRRPKANADVPLPVISRRTADWIFFGMASAYALVFGTLSLLRHQSFHSGGFDLGIFDQVIWNSLNGRLFENSIMIDSPLHLGHHFSPVLLAFVPLYALWNDPRVLLITQTLVLTLAALPIYWFARDQVGTVLAVVISAGYFLSPLLQSVNLADFHEIAFATLFLSLGVYFLLRERHLPFLVCVILNLHTKEELAFTMAAFGVFLFLIQTRRLLGLGLVVLGTAWAAATLLVVIPFFHGPAYITEYFFVGRYAYLGKNMLEIISTALTRPGLVLEHLFVPMKVEFGLHLMVPLLFLPLAGIEVFALAVPTLGYLLIGDDPFQNSIRFQYTAPLIPFISLATILGVKRIASWQIAGTTKHVRMAALAVSIGTACLANYYFQSAGPLGLHFDPTRYAITSHTQVGYEIMRQIPASAALYADAGFVPHLAHRRAVYEAAIEFIPDLHRIDYLLADLTLPVHRDFAAFWEDLLASPYFETIIEREGYLLKKRAVPPITHLTQIQFDERIALFGYHVETGEPARRGENARFILTWRAEQNIRDRYVTFVHLVDAQNRIWAQDDREPMNGWLRTDRWNAGDVTIDGFTLELPAEMPPGDYRITAGLYAATDQKTLPARDPSGKLLGSEPVLGILQVVEATK